MKHFTWTMKMSLLCVNRIISYAQEDIKIVNSPLENTLLGSRHIAMISRNDP